MKIAMTSIYVNDPLTAHTFYTEVLGFVSSMLIPEANLAIVVSAEDPEGTNLLLEPNDNPIAREYQSALYESGLPVMVFGVDDLQEAYDRLRRLGVVFRSAPEKTEWGTQVVMEDSCGNLIQLHQV